MSQSIQLATLCYLVTQDSILMLHRNKNPEDFHFGKWNGLGGKCNLRETPEDCVRREVFEESGLTITTADSLGILNFPNFTPSVDWNVHLYRSLDFSGELTENHEGSLSWIKKSDVLNLNLWPGDQVFLPYVIRGEEISGRFYYENGVYKGHEIDRTFKSL